MGFTASDLADWWDKTAEEHWDKQDDYVIQMHNLGNAHPVIVFAAWFGDRIGTAPGRVPTAIAGGLADVLRLGHDMSFESPGAAAKGIALNLFRVLSILQPLAGGIKRELRHRGLLALTKLEEITNGPGGPCQYTAFNNIVSFLRGRPTQHFADVDDIIAVGGTKNDGMFIKDLLEHPSIVKVIGGNAITWRPVAGMNTIDDVINAARNTHNPIRFDIEWADDALNYKSHALVAIKDLKGNVRIIDYAAGTPGRMGFKSWAELVAARKGSWGKGIEAANLRTDPGTPVGEFTSRIMQVLHFADGKFTFAIPVGIGIKWTRDGLNQSFNQAAPSIMQTALDFFEQKYKDKAPPRPEDLYPAPVRPPETVSVMGVHTIEGPGIQKKDWLSSIAGKYYGDVLLWPVLWDFNKGPDFTNPNKMYVGQRIKIPFIHEMPADEKKRYKQRGYNWQGESWK
jgi:hypothetical protein